MMSLSPSTRVFLATFPCDMRKSFDGLMALSRDVIGENPLSGHLFVFGNARRNRLKVLFWDGSGLWVMAKRLEKGTFAWPESTTGKVLLRHDELCALIGGLDIGKSHRREWFRIENTFEKS